MKDKGEIIMEYVKGCDFVVMTSYVAKRLDSGKLVMAEELYVSAEDFKALVAKANANYINPQGGEEKGRQAGLVYALFKKIDKQSTVLGFAYIERVGGVQTDKKGLAKLFARSTDTYNTVIKNFVPGFEKEEEYFDANVISHFKGCVGLGQVMEAEYCNKMVIPNNKHNALSVVLKLAYFTAMAVIWGWVFHSVGMGLVFGLIMSMSFNTIVDRIKAKEELIVK